LLCYFTPSRIGLPWLAVTPYSGGKGLKAKTDKLEAIFGPPKPTDTNLARNQRMQYHLKLGALTTKPEYQVSLSCQCHELTSLAATYTYTHTNTQSFKYCSTHLHDANTGLELLSSFTFHSDCTLQANDQIQLLCTTTISFKLLCRYHCL